MNEAPIKKNPQRSAWVTMIALFVGFLPSVTVLALRNGKLYENFLGPMCILSIVSCFVSSFILIRRGTTWWILCGVAFLVLNVCFSVFFLFFLGCSMIKI